MAGVDKEFMGEAFPEAGATIGYVPQEPHLTPNTTVMAQSISRPARPSKCAG